MSRIHTTGNFTVFIVFLAVIVISTMVLDRTGIIHIVPTPKPTIYTAMRVTIDSLTRVNSDSVMSQTESQFEIVKLFTYRGVTVYRFWYTTRFGYNSPGTFQVTESDTMLYNIRRK